MSSPSGNKDPCQPCKACSVQESYSSGRFFKALLNGFVLWVPSIQHKVVKYMSSKSGQDLQQGYILEESTGIESKLESGTMVDLLTAETLPVYLTPLFAQYLWAPLGGLLLWNLSANLGASHFPEDPGSQWTLPASLHWQIPMYSKRQVSKGSHNIIFTFLCLIQPSSGFIMSTFATSPIAVASGLILWWIWIQWASKYLWYTGQPSYFLCLF